MKIIPEKIAINLNTASCQISYLCSNITFHSFDEGPVGKGSERHKIGDEENETTNRQHKSKVPLEGINVRHRHQLQTQEGMAAHVLAYGWRLTAQKVIINEKSRGFLQKNKKNDEDKAIYL